LRPQERLHSLLRMLLLSILGAKISLGNRPLAQLGRLSFDPPMKRCSKTSVLSYACVSNCHVGGADVKHETVWILQQLIEQNSLGTCDRSERNVYDGTSFAVKSRWRVVHHYNERHANFG
jgi:hypothetical protein